MGASALFMHTTKFNGMSGSHSSTSDHSLRSLSVLQTYTCTVCGAVVGWVSGRGLNCSGVGSRERVCARRSG